MAKPDAIRPVLRTKHKFLCIYGAPGAGKTPLVGQYPEKRVLLVKPAFEHTDSIRISGADEWTVDGWQGSRGMEEVREYLHHQGGDDYDWVWLESISGFQDAGLDDIWEGVLAQKPSRYEYGRDKSEYGVNMTRLGVWVRHVVGLDSFNFGFTAWPERLKSPEKDEDGDAIIKYMPWIQGKNMAERMCGYTKMVAYLEKKNGKNGTYQVLRTGFNENYYTKDQWDTFENGRLVNPTMKKLDEAIDKARAASQPKTSTTATTKKRTVKKRGVRKGSTSA
jgi:hypothetical protein